MSASEGTARDAWLAWRRGGVGGSDIAALIGLSRYASPTSLFYEKTGLLEEREETQRQRIGKRMESVLTQEFNDHTDLFVVGEQTWCQHPKYEWARCTVDGFAADTPYGSAGADGDLTLGCVEFKTDGRFGWPDGVPANIRAQTIWQMGVTEHQHCWLIVMFAGFRVEVHEIHWDTDTASDWDFMLGVAQSFWLNHVLAGTPPPVDDHEATTAALTEVYHDPAGILEVDVDTRAAVLAVQRAMTITAAAEATEKRWKNHLRALLGDKTDLVDGWKPAKRKNDPPVPNVICSWRPQESRRVDLDELRVIAPDLVDQCTKTITTRVLRVAKPKESE